MKYFIAIEEDLLLKLWMHNPQLVAPLSRPFYPEYIEPSQLNSLCLKVHREAQALLPQSDG